MSEVLKDSKAVLKSSSSIPVPVLVAGIAILATRLIGIILQIHALGTEELLNFVHRSAQAWDSTLIFIASQLIFFVELRCALAILRGKNWGRWGYILSQIVILFYMFFASMGWVYPEIFSISGENNAQIIHLLISQKFPDLVIIALIFIPASSRDFFRHR